MRAVYGIGLWRTGLSSLTEAMTILGYRALPRSRCQSCKSLWRDGNVEKIVIAAASGADFADDTPFMFVYRELAKTVPEAKFILTTRSDPEVWADSIAALHKAELNRQCELDTGIRMRFFGALDPANNRARYIERYNRHNDDVRNFFKGTGRLLEVAWDAGHGWDRLCPFLGLPVLRDRPFPHVHKRSKVLQRARTDG